MNLESIVSRIEDNYEAPVFEHIKQGLNLPSRAEIISIIKDLRCVIFPGYFSDESIDSEHYAYYIGELLVSIRGRLNAQLKAALEFVGKGDDARVTQISDAFFDRLPYVQSMLLKDVDAFYDGDPAAQSKQEIIFSYPGLFAIFIYRLAHELYLQNVPLIPRIMTEYAHSGSGVDINARATIGEYFFMDHATGIVIGETTVIGNHVKLYQGVTLGALSTKDGQALSGVKRHPTIEDNVVIYSNASVLGGETVIGENSIIGGSAFIVSSVPKNTRVTVKNPELSMRTPENDN